jgi:hypothetical protein
MKLELFSRIVTAVALVALGITLGIWLSRAPLTAAPVKMPTEPTLAPSPPHMVEPTVIEVPVEVEITDMSEPPAAKPAEPKPESRPAYRPHRRDLIRRR